RDMPSAAHELETALGSVLTRLESRLAPDMLAGPNEKIVHEVAQEVQAVAAALRESQRALIDRLHQAAAVLGKHAEALAHRQAAQESEYAALVANTKDAQ